MRIQWLLINNTKHFHITQKVLFKWTDTEEYIPSGLIGAFNFLPLSLSLLSPFPIININVYNKRIFFLFFKRFKVNWNRGERIWITTPRGQASPTTANGVSPFDLSLREAGWDSLLCSDHTSAPSELGVVRRWEQPQARVQQTPTVPTRSSAVFQK